MSRYYGMGIEISEFNKDKKDEIIDEANEEWPSFSDDWRDSEKINPNADPFLSAYGEDSLTGGESDDEFCTRVTKAIWKANGGYCKVRVRSTYLEELPCEYHELSKEDYEESQL